MRNLLLGVTFGLLTLVQSIPFNAVSQTPATEEYEVLREAITDGFIVDSFFPSVTTESPQRNTTVQLSHTQYPSSDSEDATSQSPSDESDMMEASGAMEGSEENGLYQSLAPSLPPTTSSTSTVLLRDSEDPNANSFSTQSPQSGSISPSVPSVEEEEEEDLFMEETTESVAQSSLTPSRSPVSESGDERMLDTTFSTASSSSSTFSSSSTSGIIYESDTEEEQAAAELSTTPSTSTAGLFRNNGKRTYRLEPEGSGSGSGSGFGIPSESTVAPPTAETTQTPAPPPVVTEEIIKSKQSEREVKSIMPQNGIDPTSSKATGHGTPGWMIITGFVVGLAAMVLVCVAIATRDRWNGPSQASQRKEETKANQQRELEMETFLQKDKPRENGQAAEYTVIPLDELPEKDPLP
ncbi:uncharacterized protein [Centroberyx affinis]|uniref:uncharacterized protein n=1 Tax=Centroberyx affinis TaxID=166261 RepID=UPI003A5C0A79